MWYRIRRVVARSEAVLYRRLLVRGRVRWYLGLASVVGMAALVLIVVFGGMPPCILSAALFAPSTFLFGLTRSRREIPYWTWLRHEYESGPGAAEVVNPPRKPRGSEVWVYYTQILAPALVLAAWLPFAKSLEAVASALDFTGALMVIFLAHAFGYAAGALWTVLKTSPE